MSNPPTALNDGFLNRLREADTVTPELIAEFIALTVTRSHAMRYGKAARLPALMDCGAWTDVALLLLELELPQWKLRRLVFEDDEWWCTLGRHYPMPERFDDTTEAGHEVLALAILTAFMQARAAKLLETSDRPIPGLGVVPRNGIALGCENYC